MSAEFHREPNFSWPSTLDGNYARDYLTPIFRSGAQASVANADALLGVVRSGDIVLPVTHSNYHHGQSYVVSPRAHYLDYAMEEASRLHSRTLRLLGMGACCLAKLMVGTGLDSCVLVNNWLLSTNLYPAHIATHAVEILECLLHVFPTEPIIFRSVDCHANRQLFETLTRRGCRAVLARSIYYQNVNTPDFWRQRQVRVDQKRFRDSGYTLRQLSFPTDVQHLPRVLSLYNQLYLEKYSSLNPHLTLDYLCNCLQHDLLSIHALEIEGRIDGVLGYYVRNGIMTQPLFGYDTRLPQALSLYAHLSTAVLWEARRRHLLINASAGASHFKRQRGGQQVLEFNLVFDAHLPASKRRSWWMLEKLLGPQAQRIILEHGL